MGTHCDSNWYKGNKGELGEPNPDQSNHIPSGFSKDAPALLGFDESIDQYCTEQSPSRGSDDGHAANCVRANRNIFSLYGERIPFNICRNLEWMVCAAQGKLPGQGVSSS